MGFRNIEEKSENIFEDGTISKISSEITPPLKNAAEKMEKLPKKSKLSTLDNFVEDFSLREVA